MFVKDVKAILLSSVVSTGALTRMVLIYTVYGVYCGICTIEQSDPLCVEFNHNAVWDRRRWHRKIDARKHSSKSTSRLERRDWDYRNAWFD